MGETKNIAALSLDLDNLWSYLKIHGDSGWENFPSYLDVFIPYVLKILNEMNLKITFFIVGQDAVIDRNKSALRAITDEGHETGNHSFSHESWLHLLPKDAVKTEILKAEEAISEAAGMKPTGFRGPGFSFGYNILKVLYENNYLYDASTLPTYIGPLARMYYFKSSDFTHEEKNERKELFGKLSDGLKPVNPYFYQIAEHKKILEIPVTTIPLIKVPFHLSYLLYLSRISKKVMNAYLEFAIAMCKTTGTRISFLLHPLDLIGGDQIKELKFFPGMDIESGKKKEIFQEVIEKLAQNFELMNMSSFAEILLNTDKVKIIKSLNPI